MKVKLKCIESSRKVAQVGEKEQIAHFARFASLIEQGNGKPGGSIHAVLTVESLEPQHFKAGKEYDLEIGEAATILKVAAGGVNESKLRGQA